MRILLPEFVDRTDIPVLRKLQFSIQTRIEQSERVRAWYRAWHHAPRWVTAIPNFICLLLAACAVLSHTLAAELCTAPFREYEPQRRAKIVGMLLFDTILIVLPWQIPFAGIFSGAILAGMLIFCFAMEMNDFDRELRMEEDRNRHSAHTTHLLA